MNGSSTHHGSDVANASPIVSWSSCMDFCTWTEWTYLEFQFMATVFMSMATRLSDLGAHKPGVNIHTEGHTLTPPSGQNGPEDPEVFGSTPSYSPSQSPARKPTPDWPETQYCLEIQMTSAEDSGVAPPLPNMWQALIMEDMVWDGKSSLTEAIVTSPGRAIPFYGKQSLGEGLSLCWPIQLSMWLKLLMIPHSKNA